MFHKMGDAVSPVRTPMMDLNAAVDVARSYITYDIQAYNIRSQSNSGHDTPALKSFDHKVGRSVEGNAFLRSINAMYKGIP